MTSIVAYSKIEAGISALKEKYALVPDVTTEQGYKDCKKAAIEVSKYRINLEKKRKELKEPLLNQCKEIDSEAKRIQEEIAKVENPLKDAYKKIDDERAAREKERQDKLSAKINEIKFMPVSAISMNASEVSDLISKLDSYDCLHGFEERTQEALMERSTALNSLTEIFKQKSLLEAKEKAIKEFESNHAEPDQVVEIEKTAIDAIEELTVYLMEQCQIDRNIAQSVVNALLMTNLVTINKRVEEPF